MTKQEFYGMNMLKLIKVRLYERNTYLDFAEMLTLMWCFTILIKNGIRERKNIY